MSLGLERARASGRADWIDIVAPGARYRSSTGTAWNRRAGDAQAFAAALAAQDQKLLGTTPTLVLVDSMEVAAVPGSGNGRVVRLWLLRIALSIGASTQIHVVSTRDEMVVSSAALDQRATIESWDEQVLACTVNGRPVQDGATATAAADPSDPPLRLTLAPTENPVRGPLRMQLTLPSTSPSSLEVLDVAGRRVAASNLAAVRGTQLFEAPEWRDLAPGVYWLRLRQGAETATARVVLMR